MDEASAHLKRRLPLACLVIGKCKCLLCLVVLGLHWALGLGCGVFYVPWPEVATPASYLANGADRPYS